MAQVDVVIFGASGFTGRRVLLEFLRVAADKRIAVAGRNRSKLEETLSWAQRGGKASSIPIYEADVGDARSMLEICKMTRLLVSCVGPYRLYGEPVVAACVETGTDYLDVTGEPEFMERMEAKYHKKALENGSLVVSACGFDSIPAELGVIFNTKQWTPPSLPSSVDAYVHLNSSRKIRGNFATFESAVLGVSNVNDLRDLRRSRPRRAKLQIPGKPVKRGMVHWEENTGSWAVKLPSADAIVVRRTLMTVAENPDFLVADEGDKKKLAAVKPVSFGVYLCVKEFWKLGFFVLLACIFGVLASFKWGRKALLKYPEVFTAGVFSKKGPSDEDIAAASFSMWFVGQGFRDGVKEKADKEIVTRVIGPEIGYVTTPIALVQCSLLVLDERRNLARGGVLTPGAAFGVTTDLQERLQKNGIMFEVVSSKNI